MRIHTIASRDALVDLIPEWVDLYERSPDAAPFQHPSWLLPWWNRFGSGKLLCFALRDNGRLVALAPMFAHPWEGRRQVTFVGNGASDRLGLLAEPLYSHAAASQVLEALADVSPEWDLCDLQDLSPTSPFCAQEPAALRRRLDRQYLCSYIRLPASKDSFLDSLPHSLRKNLRRCREKLAECGGLQFENPSSEQAFQKALDELFALHAARWQSQGQDGMLTEQTAPFHREAAAAMWRAGKVRCLTMSVQGKTVAVSYGFLDKGRFLTYQSGFEPAWGRFSPGSLILEYAISEAIREGAHTFDFLRGEEAYKAAWGAHFEPSYRLLLWKEN